MAEADFSVLVNSISISTIDRGVTSQPTKPNGGGNFVHGFNSLSNTLGAVGLYVNLADFSPMAKGGSIRAAIRRGLSGGPLGFSPFLFIGAQGNDIGDLAYMIGLSDADPHQISIVKGLMSNGIPDAAVGVSGVLAKSTVTHANDTWLHVRLDMIFNANGDVILQAFENDLDANSVAAPVWTAIAGASEVIDDALQVVSGSPPFTSGRIGFGFQSSDVTRRGYIDHVEVLRQL